MPRLPRITVGRLMIAVAIAAVPLAVGITWFDPVRAWQRAVNDDQDGARRWEAINQVVAAAGSVDRTTALATFVEALRSSSPRVRATAVVGVGRLGHDARPAAGALLATLDDPTPHIRGSAAETLAVILPPGDPERAAALPALRRMLGDRSPHARLQAARTLVEFGDVAAALPVLVATLRRPDYLAQGEALWALGQIGPPAAPAALAEVAALEARAAAFVAPDLSRFLRVYAAETRYRLGDRTARDSLTALTANPDPELASEARRILARLPPAPAAGLP